MAKELTAGIDITDHLGPVAFVAVEFPGSHLDGEGFTRLVDLVDGGLVLVLDLEFVRRMPDGSLTTVPAGSLDVGADLSAFDGANSGLLDRDDVTLVAQGLEEGNLLAVLVYEDLTLNPVLQAWASAGARLVAEGSVDADDLEQALDATESASTT